MALTRIELSDQIPAFILDLFNTNKAFERFVLSIIGVENLADLQFADLKTEYGYQPNFAEVIAYFGNIIFQMKKAKFLDKVTSEIWFNYDAILYDDKQQILLLGYKDPCSNDILFYGLKRR